MSIAKSNDSNSKNGTEDDNSASEDVARAILAEKQSSLCSCARIKVVAVSVAIVAAAAIVLSMYLGSTEGIADIDLFRGEDPLNGTVFTWRQASGRGLDLTVINAMSPEWHPHFDLVIGLWDKGSPDGLTLTPEIRAQDTECDYVTGALKMCNGDYGSTDWKGINVLYMANGHIASSVGKMNEHFFGTGDSAKRQYTMCHEIGHGLGLPHTDERFWNRDQGNCMDYTNRFSNNFQPDSQNFETLVGLYGLVDGIDTNGSSGGTTGIGNQNSVTNAGDSSSNTASNEEVENDEEAEQNDDERNRKLRSRSLKPAESSFPTIPHWVHLALKNVNEMAVHGFVGEDWRLVRDSKHERSHEIDLGGGHSVQVHYLLATRTDYR